MIRFEEKKGHPALTLSFMPTSHNEVDHKDDAIIWNFYKHAVFPHSHQPKPSFTLYKPLPFSWIDHPTPTIKPIFLNNGPLQNPLHFLIPSLHPILHLQLCSHLQHPKPLLLHSLGGVNPRRGHAAWLRPILEPRCEGRHHRRPCLGPYRLQLRCVREWEVWDRGLWWPPPMHGLWYTP